MRWYGLNKILIRKSNWNRQSQKVVKKSKNGPGGSLWTVITEKFIQLPPIFFPFFIFTYVNLHFEKKWTKSIGPFKSAWVYRTTLIRVFIFSHFITEYVVPGAIPVCASVCVSVCTRLLFEHYWTDFDETWTIWS